MKIDWKHPPRAKRWSAGSQGMSAAATALRARHMATGRVLIKPADPGHAITGQVNRHGTQKMARGSLRSGISTKQQRTVAPAGQQPDDDRARRLEVLMGTFGMWKGREDLPQDGLQYQLEMRAEWD